MGLHQDKDESAASLEAGLPVVPSRSGTLRGSSSAGSPDASPSRHCY